MFSWFGFRSVRGALYRGTEVTKRKFGVYKPAVDYKPTKVIPATSVQESNQSNVEPVVVSVVTRNKQPLNNVYFSAMSDIIVETAVQEVDYKVGKTRFNTKIKRKDDAYRSKVAHRHNQGYGKEREDRADYDSTTIYFVGVGGSSMSATYVKPKDSDRFVLKLVHEGGQRVKPEDFKKVLGNKYKSEVVTKDKSEVAKLLGFGVLQPALHGTHFNVGKEDDPRYWHKDDLEALTTNIRYPKSIIDFKAEDTQAPQPVYFSSQYVAAYSSGAVDSKGNLYVTPWLNRESTQWYLAKEVYDENDNGYIMAHSKVPTPSQLTLVDLYEVVEKLNVSQEVDNEPNIKLSADHRAVKKLTKVSLKEQKNKNWREKADESKNSGSPLSGGVKSQ
jgi:hypothetical protein